MKTVLIAAAVAAVIAPASAMATSWIDGHSIRPQSIPLNRLTSIPRGIDRSNVSIVKVSAQLPQFTDSTTTAHCPSGTVAVGGGGTSGFSQLIGSSPLGGRHPTGWSVKYGNPGPSLGTDSVSAYVICAAP